MFSIIVLLSIADLSICNILSSFPSNISDENVTDENIEKAPHFHVSALVIEMETNSWKIETRNFLFRFRCKFYFD